MTRNNIRIVLGKTTQLTNICRKQNLLDSFPVIGTTKSSSTNNNYSTKAKKENFFNIPKQLHNKLMNILVPDFKNYSSSSVNSNNNSIHVLNPVQYEEWSKDEVCSLLCTPEENGGASLTIEDVKPLYDAGFKGTSIGNIVTYIQKKDLFFAMEQVKQNKDYQNISQTTLELVVFWVDNLLKTKLYHLWSPEKMKEKLTKSTEEEGAGLTEEEFTGLNLKTLLNKQNPTTEQKVAKWKQIMNISISLKQDFKVEDIGWLKSKIALLKKVEEKYRAIAVDQIYNEAYLRLCSTPTPTPTLSDLLKLECPPPSNQIQFLWNDQIPNFASSKLPITKIGGKFIFQKQYLPYIPSHQTFTEMDNQIDMTSKNFILISPSGSGKTGLIVRSLSKNPGIMITGSHRFGGGVTMDIAVNGLMEFDLQKPITAFAIARQKCILLIISKLLHISNLIKRAEKDDSLLDPFEGNLYSFLAFNQWNINTKSESILFDELVKQYQWCKIEDLRRLAISLLRCVTTELKSTQYGKANDFNNLAVCVDEAHILEEYSPFNFLSSTGKERGLLSVLAFEIALLKDEVGPTFYAGTSFTIDIAEIIQSVLMKTEAMLNPIYLTRFHKLNQEQFFEYVNKHVVLDDATKTRIMETHSVSFPIRIRQAAFFLELYINNRLDNRDYSTSFAEASRKPVDEITKKIDQFIGGAKEQKIANAYYKQMRSVLLNYIIHFTFPGLFSPYFVETDRNLAQTLLSSGLTSPIDNSMKYFAADDALGYQVAKQFLTGFREFPGTDMDVIALANYLLYNTTDNTEVERVISLGLLKLSENKKLVQDILPKVSVAQGSTFQCHKILNGAGYLEYCEELGFKKEGLTGEQMFIENIAEKRFDLLYGVAFSPSTSAHSDIFLTMQDSVGEPYFLTFSVKVLTGKDLMQDQGFKSTVPHLMYLNNYNYVSIPEVTKIIQLNNPNKFPLLDEAFAKKKTPFYDKNIPEAKYWHYKLPQLLKVIGTRFFPVIVHIHPTKLFDVPDSYPKNISWIGLSEISTIFPELKDSLHVFLKTISNRGKWYKT